MLEKLKKDVADWKGLQPEGFGDLLCFGDFNIMMRTKNYTDRTRKVCLSSLLKLVIGKPAYILFTVRYISF